MRRNRHSKAFCFKTVNLLQKNAFFVLKQNKKHKLFLKLLWRSKRTFTPICSPLETSLLKKWGRCKKILRSLPDNANFAQTLMTRYEENTLDCPLVGRRIERRPRPKIRPSELREHAVPDAPNQDCRRAVGGLSKRIGCQRRANGRRVQRQRSQIHR